jgi:branched-chain amino acid transport system substrate-binding protein
MAREKTLWEEKAMKKVSAVAGVAALALVWAGAAGQAGAAAKTMTIGFTVSETGALNVDSVNQLHGFELWRDQVNADGGIKVGDQRYTVEFVHYDDQSKPERVQQLYSRLILDDKADFLFSPYSSGLTATSAIISEQYGKVMLTTGAAEDKTYTLGNKGLFQLYTPATHYLSAAMKVIKDKDPTARVAIAYSDDGFSKAVAIAAKDEAKSLGEDVVFNEAYAPTTTDFGPIINKMIAAKADVMVGGGHYADGATLARQLYDQKVPLRFISLLVAPDSDQFATLGESAIGVTVPSQWEPSAAYKPDFGPTGAAFAATYKAKFHADAPYHAAGGYAAGLILQHAIETAGSLDSAKVTAALDATDATIFFGHIKFATDAGHHGLQVGHDMVLAQWQKKGGTLVKEVIWPQAAETAPLLYPIR